MKKHLFALLLPGLFCAPLSAANILFIGDSHVVGPFGKKIDGFLRTVPGAKVGSYGSCGSIFQWWETGKATSCGYFFRGTDGDTKTGTASPTPVFGQLVSEIKPSLVVVELGANYTGYPSDDFVVNDMKKLVKKISDSGAKCFWVTMPDSRAAKPDVPRILQLTSKAVTPYCTYFDSTQVTHYPATGGDGTHYEFPAALPIANAWAEAAFKAMQPLLKDLPADQK